MISQDSYRTMLLSKGKNLSQVRQFDSAIVMNNTFTGDIGYKKVFILNKDKGWIYEDAKHSKHATPSILRDAVDYYLQFRPKIHYPIGTYVFIPNDMDYGLGFSEESPDDPFQDENFDINKLWMIVGRNDANEFVRYNIIKCNWNFRWVYKLHGENVIMNVFGSVRGANSYTAGVWSADYSTELDNVINAWFPDTYLLYGDKLKEYNLCDTRYYQHEQRFMLTHNQLDPKVYYVTKVQDLVPQGIIKSTLKQGELDEVRDNVELMLCDYYDASGEIALIEPTGEDVHKTSYIWTGHVNSEGELEIDYVNQEIRDRDYNKLNIGATYYYAVEFYDNDNTDVISGIDPEWRIDLIDTEGLSEKEIQHLDNLMVMTKFDESILSIRVGKSSKLIGKSFTLSVMDKDGEYASSMTLEVQG